MTKPPRSLQWRLLGLLLVGMVSVWLATGIMTWIDARHELDELLDSHLAQAAALLVVQQSGEFEEGDHEIDAPSLHRYAPKVAFQVFHEGQMVLRSANAPRTPMIPGEMSLKTRFETVRIAGIEWRVFATFGAEHDVQVYVGEQMRSRESILWAVLRSTLWPFAIALPLLALGAWWVVSRSFEPLRRLGRKLAGRRPQDLTPFELTGASAEMLPMIEALNGLFGRISSLLESERRFTADAAHELRTPIAAIRAQAQVAMAEADPALRQHALQSTLDGCDRAARLITQMLTLSRLETVSEAAMQNIDLGALTERITDELAIRAGEKTQQVEVSAARSCSVFGDETLLAVLMRNLIDNAMRYSPTGARIKVDLQKIAGQMMLSVQDSGPGMSEADRRRLGERFFRVSGSNESGSGLGWSIIRRIAAVHRLDLKVEASAELGGLAVRVVWPLEAAQG